MDHFNTSENLFFKLQGHVLIIKNNKQRENERFYIQSSINKISNLLCGQNNTRNVWKVEKPQANRGLVSFYFLHQSILFFSCRVFFYKPQTSHRFSPIYGRYFCHRFFEMTDFNAAMF